jgi:hypothetical protein
VPYEKLLLANAQSWLDFPFPGKDIPSSGKDIEKTRVFLTSALHRESDSSRPLWYFLTLYISQEDWRILGSHRRLCKAMEHCFPSGWAGKDPEELKNSIGKLKLSTDDVNARIIEAEELAYHKNLEKVFGELEKDINMANETDFGTSQVAIDPAYSPEGDEWVSTRDCSVWIVKRPYDENRRIPVVSRPTSRPPKKNSLPFVRVAAITICTGVVTGIAGFFPLNSHRKNPAESNRQLPSESQDRVFQTPAPPPRIDPATSRDMFSEDVTPAVTVLPDPRLSPDQTPAPPPRIDPAISRDMPSEDVTPSDTALPGPRLPEPSPDQMPE